MAWKHKIMTMGQSTIEFTFVMIAILLLTYGLIRIFCWAGLDLAERRFTHEQVLTNGATAVEQLVPDFYRPKRLNSVYKGTQ